MSGAGFKLITSSLPYSFPAGFGAGTPQQESVPRGQEFSRIENLWPRDDSYSSEQKKNQNCTADSANGSGFLVIRSKYCFMKLQPHAAGDFCVKTVL